MSETIIFPDVVKAMIPYLKTRLTARGQTAVVSYRVPSPRPATLVRLSTAGGTRLALTKRETRLLVEAWDVDESKASDLAELCAAEVEAATRSQSPIATGVWIDAADDAISVPVNFPDPLTSTPRFQFYANLILTGSSM